MMRRLIAIFMAVVMCCLYCMLPANAATLRDGIYVLEQDRLDQIDALYAMRARLELDFDANIEQIERIDDQLAALGVEEISQIDLMQKLGQTVSPNVNVSSTSSTAWTSTRTIVNYYGEFYELQIITGTPTTTASQLYKSYDIDVEKNAGVQAALVGAFKVIAENVAGEIPVVGEILAAGKTIYDVAEACHNGMSPTTVVSDIDGSFTISMSAHEKYIFIKMQGSADSTQICGYVGNSAEWTVGVSLPLMWDKDGDGDLDTDVVQYTYDSSIVGVGYNNSYEISSKNFYNYRRGVQTFHVDYRLYNVTMKFLYDKNTGVGYSQRLRIPTDEMSFLG